ncbi:MAG: helix-turn-helix domain-containing protein [Clostridia bacterium]|nr:helix-turn-helix domain-containing protein [Clostridia bacterium]
MNRLKILREEKNLNQADVANFLNITSAAAGQYERGVRDLSTDKLIKLANFFGVTTDYLLGISNTRVSNGADLNNLLHIPVLGKVPAGVPVLAVENIIKYLPISPDMFSIKDDQELFFLKVDGESMNNIVDNGSYVLIKKQEYAENGDIVVALVNNDDEATLKRYKIIDKQFVMLEPDSSNPEFEPIIVNLKNQNFRIIGKVIGSYKEW